MARFNAEKKLAELQHRIEQELLLIYRILLQHDEYHQGNEHRWGLRALMARHPVKTLLSGIILGLALAYGFDITPADLLEVLRGL